jgi:thymidylate synthase (FAD)
MKIAKQEVTLLDSCGSDLSVVNAARVSFAKQSSWTNVGEYEHDGGDLELAEKDAKLINYLAKHKHKSPFNHCFMSFRVKAPIFVARQLVKHEYLPWNEVSRRYVTDEPEFFMPDYWRKAADNVKQGSSDEKAYMMVDLAGEDWLVSEVMHDFTNDCLFIYKNAIKAGVCPEQARMVLPQNTMTEWIWSGTLFAFAKMCKLRLDPHTQKETQEIAQLISNEASKLYPTSWKALMEYGEC